MNNGRIQVLVADNDMTAWSGKDKALPEEHYEVAYVYDGEEAVKQYLSQRPDVLVCDLGLPSMDGLQVIDYIRSQANDTDLYILAVANDSGKRFDALNAGANDFLAKPCAKDDFLARLGAAVRQVRLNKQLHQAYERIKREIVMVADLQCKLLPEQRLSMPGLRIESFYRSSGHASGDYYDYFQFDENVLRLVIADVSGHGARAAFLMAVVRTLFRSTQSSLLDLPDTVGLINTHLKDIVGEESDFVTLFAADVDVIAKQITYVNAGHCPGLLRSEGERMARLEPTASVLGFFDQDLHSEQVNAGPGDGLFLFTDGFYEWEVAPGEMLGLDRFIDMVKTCCVDDGDFYIEKLTRRMEQLGSMNPVFRDDLSALWIELEAA